MIIVDDMPMPQALSRDSITQLVNRFYEDVRADSLLGPTFEAVLDNHWVVHLERMVEFWSTLTLGTRSFSGNVFGKHMAVTGVTPLHFERWLRLWHQNTGALFDSTTASQLQEAALGIARNLYRGFFGHVDGYALIASESRRDAR